MIRDSFGSEGAVGAGEEAAQMHDTAQDDKQVTTQDDKQVTTQDDKQVTTQVTPQDNKHADKQVTTQDHPPDAAPSPSPEVELLAERARALRAQAASLAKSLDKATKALDGLLRQQPWGVQSAQAAAKALGEPELLAQAQLEAPWRALLADIQALTEAQALTARQHLLTRLRDAASQEGISFERLSDSPPTLALQPFTVEIDWEANAATLLFGREPVAEGVPLEASAILLHRAQAMKAIQAAAVPSERFFGLLKLSWQVTVTARGLADDARVDLVDLLGPLSLLSSPPDGWRSLKERDLKPYPRAMLVYQLYRLRRDRALERDGWRLDMGAATGGATKKKQNVLFIPTAPGDGQYYLTVRFIQTHIQAHSGTSGDAT